MGWTKGKPRGANATIPVGESFNFLTVLDRDAAKTSRVHWLCKCACGSIASVAACDVKRGHTKSCGCHNAITRCEANIKHGHNRTRTYISWCAMLARCTNAKLKSFEHYGGRGISVCDRWKSFQNFVDDMGERPAGMSIDRYPNNDGNYEPGNCRWATASEQRRNQRPRIYVRAAAAMGEVN